MKAGVAAALVLSAGLVLGAGEQGRDGSRGSSRLYEVTFTNITQKAILTPPIFSLSQKQIDVFRVGEPASLGLQMLAEGGATDALRDELLEEGVEDFFQMMMPVMPGKSASVMLEGSEFSRLNLASMLLPTNDGFVAMNGPRVFDRGGSKTFYLRAYDSGSEMNDEVCASIPGPQCGGDGFNEDGGEGFVAPHAGLHGEGELSRRMYAWGDPVARVTVTEVRE